MAAGLGGDRKRQEEAPGIRLVAALRVRTGRRQRSLGEGARLLPEAAPQLRLGQGAETEHLKVDHFGCHGLFHLLREQRHICERRARGPCEWGGSSAPRTPATRASVSVEP
jgi:hypothetical protein